MAAEVHAVGPGLAALTGSTSPGANRYRAAPAGRRQGHHAHAVGTWPAGRWPDTQGLPARTWQTDPADLRPESMRPNGPPLAPNRQGSGVAGHRESTGLYVTLCGR